MRFKSILPFDAHIFIFSFFVKLFILLQDADAYSKLG